MIGRKKTQRIEGSGEYRRRETAGNRSAKQRDTTRSPAARKQPLGDGFPRLMGYFCLQRRANGRHVTW